MNEMRIETDVAKFLRILSAYATHKATTIPPVAWNAIAVQTTPLYPYKNPFCTNVRPHHHTEKDTPLRRGREWTRVSTFSKTCEPSFHKTPRNKAGNKLKTPNCTFLTQRVAVLPFNTFSKYTPANPLNIQATTTAMNPTVAFILSSPYKSWSCRGPLANPGAEKGRSSPESSWEMVLVAVVEDDGSWTRATPRVRRMSETHCWMERVRCSNVTLKRAVVRILSW